MRGDPHRGGVPSRRIARKEAADLNEPWKTPRDTRQSFLVRNWSQGLHVRSWKGDATRRRYFPHETGRRDYTFDPGKAKRGLVLVDGAAVGGAAAHRSAFEFGTVFGAPTAARPRRVEIASVRTATSETDFDRRSYRLM